MIDKNKANSNLINEQQIKELIKEIEQWYIFARFSPDQDLNRISRIIDEPFDTKIELYTIYQELNDVIRHFLRDVWTARDYDEIELTESLCKNLEEGYSGCLSESIINFFSRYAERKKEDNVYRRYFLYAKGYAELVYVKEAIVIAEDLLQSEQVDRTLEIEIRSALSEWYESIIGYNKRCLHNEEVLSELLDDLGDQKKYLKELLKRPTHDLDEIVDLLEIEDNAWMWDYIYNEKICTIEVFIELYNRTRPQYKLPLDVYNWLFNNCIDVEINKMIYERIKIYYPDFYYIDTYFIQILLKEEKWDQIINIDNEVKDKDGYNLAKGKALYHLKKYNEAVECMISLVNREDKYNAFPWILQCYIKMNNKQKAIAFVVNVCAEEDWFHYYMKQWIEENTIEESLLIEILKQLHYLKRIYVYSSDFRDVFEYILHITDFLDLSIKGSTRLELLHMYSAIEKIMSKQLWEQKPYEKLYHYSSEKSIKYLPHYSNDIGGSPFRLGNVSFLNDPQEGKVLSRIMNIKSDEDDYRYKNIYLGCFSLNADNLQMWVHYAENGKGLCYEIDPSVFHFPYSSSVKYLIDPLKKEYDSSLSVPCALYRVYYFDEEKSDDEIIKLCKEIKGNIEKLQAVCINNKRIQLLIDNLLDNIRYLFKDKAYESENEIRIIQRDYNNERKVEFSESSVSRIYLELAKELYFPKVIFGPKAERKEQKAAYLRCCCNVGSIAVSNIQYQ